jgi:hypothetical protein
VVARRRPEPEAEARPRYSMTECLERLSALADRVAGEPYVREVIHPSMVRTQIERLVHHPSAFTIGRLLDEPAVRARDVVTIAARRPTTDAIVRQLTSRSRWMQVPAVRVAILENPFTPTRVSLILAPTCLARLGAIASANVHPLVRELTRLLRGRGEKQSLQAGSSSRS